MSEIEKIHWSITAQEKELCHRIKEYALRKGAENIRINLNKSVMEQFLFLNSELDKVSHSADRTLVLNLFINGRYGSCSINNLEEKGLEDFVDKTISFISMLEEDKCRQLPKKEKYCNTAQNGDELGLCDYKHSDIETSQRIEKARECSIYQDFKNAKKDDFDLISEEINYSDSIYDSYLIDSQGLECRHIESSFEISIDLTIEDKKGNKYTGYEWNASTQWDRLDTENLASRALERATKQLNSTKIQGGKYNMIVENEIAFRLVSPILSALNGSSIQQHNSFLLDSLNKQIFHKGFNLKDMPTEYGRNGSKLYDSEGMSYTNSYVIENGVVNKYFISTYIANKLGIQASNEDCPRPVLLPYNPLNEKMKENESFALKEILELCQDGIYVTGFNGGNNNSSSGDFSYGVEGYVIENGKIGRAVRGMVITGNFIDLWNQLLAAGNDYRLQMSRQMPTIAFKDVSFSI